MSQNSTGNYSNLGFHVQQDKIIYHYYPSGII